MFLAKPKKCTKFSAILAGSKGDNKLLQNFQINFNESLQYFADEKAMSFNPSYIYLITALSLACGLILMVLLKRRKQVIKDEMPTSILDFFKKSTHFNRLSDSDLAQLAKVVHGGVLTQGQVLFSEGAEEDCAYIVVKGELDIYQKRKGQNVLLATIGEQQIIGEMALLSGEPRSATIVAKTNCWLLQISKEAFSKISASNPRIRSKVLLSNSYRLLENAMRDKGIDIGKSMKADKWLELAMEMPVDKKKQPVPTGVEYLFLFHGELQIADKTHFSPELIAVTAGQEISGEKGTTIYWLPPAKIELAA